MKTKFLIKIVAITLASSILFQSCLGSFTLTNKLIQWNKTVTDNKFANSLIFLILTSWVGAGVLVIDTCILNLIEFWTDSNPLAYNSQEITNEKGEKFLVETTPAGHKIINQETNEIVSFLFDKTEKSWSIETKNGVEPLFICISDTHVKLNNGSVVQLSEAGLHAFRTAQENQRNLALK
jgi:hypothetical protein